MGEAINIRDAAQWASLLRAEPRRPVLVHLNGDTTWLLQLPCPAVARAAREPHRTHFNLLLDPWLQGPQSDVASWFSTQYHVVAPAVPSLDALQAALRTLEPTAGDDADHDQGSRIDAVAISHEFTDHCHRATLEQLPRSTPIYAADAAADLIRRWGFFDTDAVLTAPGLAAGGMRWTSLAHARLPAWLRIGRLVTPGNSLYYHSALVIAFATSDDGAAEAVVYSPHGIAARDVAAVLPPSSDGLASTTTLAMLHGLHDVRLRPAKQLNLGALNAVEAVRAAGARYWIATHDEEKTGKGLIAPLLRRTRYTLREAVAHDEKTRRKKASAAGQQGGEDEGFEFRELASGEALLLK